MSSERWAIRFRAHCRCGLNRMFRLLRFCATLAKRGMRKEQLVSIRFRLMAAAAIALAMAYPAYAADPAPSTGNMSDEISALKARLDQLEASQKEAERLHQEAERKLEDKITLRISFRRMRRSRTTLLSTADGLPPPATRIIDSSSRVTTATLCSGLGFTSSFGMWWKTATTSREPRSIPKPKSTTGLNFVGCVTGFDGNLFLPDVTYFINWATSSGPAAMLR